jgi:hypothetical protein
MTISLRTTSLLVVTTAFAAACGGNVVLDGSGGGTPGVGGAGGAFPMTSGTTGTSTGTTGTVGNGTTTTGGFSTSTSTGFGGFGTSTTTSTGFGTSTSTSSSTGFSSTSTSSTSSSGFVGDCTQGGDPKAFYNPNLNAVLTMCAQAHLGNSAATAMCIEQGTGVSSGCLMCLNDDVTCAEQHCLNNCIPPNTESKACVSCRATYCDPTFVTCSGMLAAPGSQTCAGVLGGGPTVTPVQAGLLPSAFVTTAGDNAYTALMNCACNTVTTGNSPGCQNICDDHLNGTNVPNYCNGSVASSQCMDCLKTYCEMTLITCGVN